MSQLDRVLAGLVDAGWYRIRYPDTAGLDPAEHFAHFGMAEGRDPNRFFDGAFYANEYPQAAASGTPPLLHYLFVGAAEHLDPHPRFDAAWYVSQHPEAAANPLLFHLRTGQRHGFPTCLQLDIRDFQPSGRPPLAPPTGVTADVLILPDGSPDRARRCADLVLARSGPRLGQVVLLRAARRAVTTEAVNRAIGQSGEHDVVLLDASAEVPEGWLDRLMVHAYAASRVASISPLLCRTLPAGTSPAGADA
ncbi:MAG TPA: hypothetical protein VE690_06655, partial [Rhodopila sp.]|nr:hypothetical protein [Rhodopila sp.]